MNAQVDLNILWISKTQNTSLRSFARTHPLEKFSPFFFLSLRDPQMSLQESLVTQVVCSFCSLSLSFLSSRSASLLSASGHQIFYQLKNLCSKFSNSRRSNLLLNRRKPKILLVAQFSSFIPATYRSCNSYHK